MSGLAPIFVDTSALYALVVRNDPAHPAADTTWRELRAQQALTVTSSYVLLETMALLQSRIGIEPVQVLDERFTPLLDVVWVDAELHAAGLALVLARRSRRRSLVDAVSFAIMRRDGLDQAFTFDADFADEGFAVLPG